MNYMIDSEEIVKVSGSTVTVRAVLWVSSVSDLPEYDSISGRSLAAGSVAFVIGSSEIYVLGFDNSWTAWEV